MDKQAADVLPTAAKTARGWGERGKSGAVGRLGEGQDYDFGITE